MIESSGDWSSCELEEHIEEVRTRNEELARMLAQRPFDGYVLEVVYLLSAAATEMRGHAALAARRFRPRELMRQRV